MPLDWQIKKENYIGCSTVLTSNARLVTKCFHKLANCSGQELAGLLDFLALQEFQAFQMSIAPSLLPSIMLTVNVVETIPSAYPDAECVSGVTEIS